MKKLICTLFLVSASLRLVAAGEKTDPNASKSQPTIDATAPIELKNKSSFAMDESGRNPFWPIGWKPSTKKIGNEPNTGSDIRETAFLVTSITTGERHFAIINGKVMTEGQVFGLQMGSQTYQLTVKAIQDGQVIIQRRDQEIVVPLRRK